MIRSAARIIYTFPEERAALPRFLSISRAAVRVAPSCHQHRKSTVPFSSLYPDCHDAAAEIDAFLRTTIYIIDGWADFLFSYSFISFDKLSAFIIYIYTQLYALHAIHSSIVPVAAAACHYSAAQPPPQQNLVDSSCSAGPQRK